MSGAPPPLRSLWFGEGLTSATTEDSGRNSDATIRAPPGREVDLTCATRKLVASGGGDCAETAMRDTLARAAVTANPRMLLQASRTLKLDGRAGLWPTRPSHSGLPSSRLRYPLTVQRS